MIRSYQAGDKPDVISIWQEASKLAHPFLTDDQMDQATTMVRDHFLDIAETYIAEQDGQAVGFVALLGNEVGGLFLRPRYHGQRIGKALMDKAVEAQGAVHLEVFVDNPIGRRFYQSYGFVEGIKKTDPVFGYQVLELTFTPG